MSARSRRIVIVGGCGHVGLPLGLVLADVGARVWLLDIDKAKVGQINAGEMPFREDGAEPLLRRHVGKALTATTDQECLRDAEVVITVVGTPVDRHLSPDMNEVYRAMDDVIGRMPEDSLLILRSTVYPGITKLIFERIQTLDRRILLAFCPERIAEGKAIEELRALPQLVSAFEPRAMAAAKELFLTIAPQAIELSPLEAELAKLFSNSWRYLNFAISNQFFLLAESYGLDFYRIYDAATRDYPRMKSFAKPGFAAGPCLLKDTLHLGAFAQNNFFMGHAAMLINEGLPNFIVEKLRRSGDVRRRVAILGMAFKANSDDPRESLSYKLRNLLALEAKEVLCTDPYVKDASLVPLETALEKAEVVILGAPHSVYRELEIPADKLVVDIWGFWKHAVGNKLEIPLAAATPSLSQK
ncbi:MAG TPA: nucleotide sugar dehydrogenase [Candidatus Acidoferrales bacterium]|nr:nucleotide sugar dehydrogenase [Candidatus Acidoferrales bacterium]